MTNLPAIHKPLHVVQFSNGAIEYIASEKVDEFKKELNENRAVQIGDKIYASRLFETCEPFSSKDGLEIIVATCPRELRKRLTVEIAKYKEATGKQMPANTAQCHLEEWKKI